MATTQKAANTALPGTRSALTFRLQMALDEQQQLERAARIKQLREESPYTQAALADRIGVTPRAYQRWEEGGGIEWDHLEKLAEVHGVEVMWVHRGAGRGPTVPSPLDALSGPASTAELAEEVRQTNSELAEVRGELSEVRTELERVLSQLLRDARAREGSRNG